MAKSFLLLLVLTFAFLDPAVAAMGVQARKLGKHNIAPATSPSPGSEAAFVGSMDGQEIHLENQHHHSLDRSVAGGGVILGGLATTFLVAIFCYVRATRRHSSHASTDASAAS